MDAFGSLDPLLVRLTNRGSFIASAWVGFSLLQELPRRPPLCRTPSCTAPWRRLYVCYEDYRSEKRGHTVRRVRDVPLPLQDSVPPNAMKSCHTVRHGLVDLLHHQADLILEQEIGGRGPFRRVWVARLIDSLPFRIFPFLGMVSFAFTHRVGLGRNDWGLWGMRHHLLYVQLRVHPIGEPAAKSNPIGGVGWTTWSVAGPSS